LTNDDRADDAVGSGAGRGASYGLLAAEGFDVVPAPSSWPGVPRQALWYFRGETIALPRPGVPVGGFGRGVDAFTDVETWAAPIGDAVPVDAPPLVWVAAPDALHGARVAPAGDSVAARDHRFVLDLVARNPLNRSWIDASSFAFLAQHPLTLRGSFSGDRFVARTTWPEDFALRGIPPVREWDPARPALALRAMMREEPQGGARSPFAAATLWQRAGTRPEWSGKPVLAFIVNGAQGDDDEAHAGHFALVTGRVRADGAIGDWLVHNFYSLDAESEKGIVAAPVPLDNYLGDLNAGQAWYRPSYLLVAVLDDARAPLLVQSALARIYAQFYRHQIVYYHPCINCTSLSLDTLAALGWKTPARGAAAPRLARLALPWLVVRERGLRRALQSADYLAAETTRLLPAAALEEIAASLHALATGSPVDGGKLARWLARDLAAIALLRIPQIPSSRAFGDAPVVTLAEYRARLPAHRRDYQVVPVPARPFPPELRDDDLRPTPRTPAQRALAGWIAGAGVVAAAGAWLGRR
jgi:hypothetical protein